MSSQFNSFSNYICCCFWGSFHFEYCKQVGGKLKCNIPRGTSESKLFENCGTQTDFADEIYYLDSIVIEGKTVIDLKLKRIGDSLFFNCLELAQKMELKLNPQNYIIQQFKIEE